MPNRSAVAISTSAAASPKGRLRKALNPRIGQFATNVVIPLLIVVVTFIAGIKTGPTRAYWSLAIFIAVFVSGVVSYSKDRAASKLRDQAIGSKTDLATALNDTGQPLVAAVGNVTAADSAADAENAMSVLLDRAVDLARTELARSTESLTRAVFYSFDGNKLVRKKFYGWTGCESARQEFVQGRNEHDDEVIKFAHGENALLVPDLENRPPPHFIDYKGKPYKSFVSVPVRAGNKSFGLLAADSDQAYALTNVERGYLILIAGAIGAGMAHVESIESKAREQGTGPSRADGDS